MEFSTRPEDKEQKKLKVFAQTGRMQQKKVLVGHLLIASPTKLLFRPYIGDYKKGVSFKVDPDNWTIDVERYLQSFLLLLLSERIDLIIYNKKEQNPLGTVGEKLSRAYLKDLAALAADLTQVKK